MACPDVEPPLHLVSSRAFASAASDEALVRGLVDREAWAATELWTRYGRIVEAKPGGGPQALAWYDRHLEEAPGGAYASEALGRKMTVLARLRGEKAARPVAEEYLRRYPGGTYARAARAYAGTP